MRLLARVRAVSGPVEVEQHAVFARPLGHGLNRGVADGEVDHDDDRTDLFGELGAFVHLFHVARGHVHVVALDLAGLGLRALDGFHAVEKAVAPAHERLRIDVLVVLDEVEAAAQRLVDDAPVVASGESQLRLGRRADERAPELVEHLAFHDDAVRRTLERLDVDLRNAHVLEPQRHERFETEDVADDGRRQIRDRVLFEEIDVVRDVGDVLVAVGNGVHAIALGLVVLVRRQAVGPHDGPGGRRRLARDRGPRFDGVDALLRNEPERAQHVGVFGLVVGVVIAHLHVRQYAGRPSVRLAVARRWGRRGH